MAQFEVTVYKQFNDRIPHPWSNNYNVLADNILDAADYGDQIAAIEAAILWDNVTVSGIRVAPVSVPGAGYTRLAAVPGERTDADPAVQLPTFNTVLAQFLPSIGRPSNKFLRLPLVEAEVTGGQLESTFQSLLVTDYLGPIVALGVVCNQAGSLIISSRLKVAVESRQLGWHRRARPGFHRGYVAD